MPKNVNLSMHEMSWNSRSKLYFAQCSVRDIHKMMHKNRVHFQKNLLNHVQRAVQWNGG
jgi:hypothetical protein